MPRSRRGAPDEVFDAASGTFGVRVALPNPDRVLPGAARCRVQFDQLLAPAAGAAAARGR